MDAYACLSLNASRRYLSCGYNQFVEACFLHWLSKGNQPNGMVLRLQGFDEGVFGGHFHTANVPDAPPHMRSWHMHPPHMHSPHMHSPVHLMAYAPPTHAPPSPPDDGSLVSVRLHARFAPLALPRQAPPVMCMYMCMYIVYVHCVCTLCMYIVYVHRVCASLPGPSCLWHPGT